MDGVAVITGPRTGAGYLFSLLPNIEAISARGDLLAEGLANLGGRLDLAELEARGEGKRVLALKLTSAVPRDIVERDILNRRGMRVVLVVRRQIDCYVSLVKATALDTWRDFDTSAIKVKLDAERFAQWMDDEAAWYAHWRAWLEKRALPCPILRYETNIDLPPDVALRRFAQSTAQIGIPLRAPETLSIAGTTRQDRNKAVAGKVKNWPDFSRALVALGIEKRAFGYPI
jgi:hypothetical protein